MTSIHTLAGRLGGDPELKYSTSGTAVCTFSLAVNTGWGERQRTTWYRVTAFGKTAENANQLLKKGSWVMVHGESYTEDWTGKDGKTRTTAKIDIKDFTLPPRETSNSNPGASTIDDEPPF